MRVSNLNDLDLAQNTVVQRQLLSLEVDEHFLAQVDRQQIRQLLHRFDFTIEALNFVSHDALIRFILEQSGQGLLTGSDILQVLLSVSLLLLKFADTLFAFDTLIDSVFESSQVKDLTLGPVIDINVGVLEVSRDLAHVLENFGVVGVRHNQLAGVHVSIVLQVHVFVALSGAVQVLVRLDRVQLGAHHLSSLALDLVEQGFDDFLEVKELGDARVVLLFLHEVILHQIDVGDGLQTLKFLGSAHRHKLFKCLLHVEALGAGEELEFLRLEDKIESSDLAQVTLQVEGTIL